MLRSIKELHDYGLDASDGQIGRCKDFLFDDQRWTIRYMVADTGGWLTGRQVLLSPALLGEPRWSDKALPVRLTRQQIEAAPSIDEHMPVSRHHETALALSYGYPFYWQGYGVWGTAATPYQMGLQTQAIEQAAAVRASAARDAARDQDADSHLRSVREVTGYHIRATDDEIGHVEDFILDDESWSLRYVVVDTRNWFPGRKVLISPDWIETVEWSVQRLAVRVTKQEIKDSPAYDPKTPVNRAYETRLYDFYGRPSYWAGKQPVAQPAAPRG